MGRSGPRSTRSSAERERSGIQHHEADSSRPRGPQKSWSVECPEAGGGWVGSRRPGVWRNGGGAGGGPGPGAGRGGPRLKAAGRAGGRRAQSQQASERASERAGAGASRPPLHSDSLRARASAPGRVSRWCRCRWRPFWPLPHVPGSCGPSSCGAPALLCPDSVP